MDRTLNPRIRSLLLKRFRSIPQEVVRFSNPCFFVGQNGSGKSNFVDAFAFLSEAMVSPLQAVFDRRGGISAVRNRTASRSRPPNFGIAIEFGDFNAKSRSARYALEIRALKNYGFEVVREQCRVESNDGRCFWFDREGSKFRTNIQGLHPALDPALLGLPTIAGDERLAPVLRTLSALRVYRIDPAALREMQDPDSGMSLGTEGKNAASVLQEIERQSTDDVDRLCEILSTIVPNTESVRAKKHGNKVSLEFTQKWGESRTLKFEGFSMSDGTLRAVGMLLAVFQRPTPSLIAVEEPEATIHPGALGAVLDLLRLASHKAQVVVTTHSPEVLDAKWIREDHIRVVSWENGATRISGLSDASKQAIREHLMGAGELMRADALHPAPLFADVESGQMDLFLDNVA